MILVKKGWSRLKENLFSLERQDEKVDIAMSELLLRASEKRSDFSAGPLYIIGEGFYFTMNFLPFMMYIPFCRPWIEFAFERTLTPVIV